tara:strand:- start:540 stop:2981 length:2442 start_codon:yes stop_codon:yes gene_type:complete
MNKHDFSVINYTDQEIPVFQEKQGQNYVSYGFDDLYGDYLRDLFLASSTNGAIINGVADMIYGGGLDATDRDDSDSKREQWLRLQDLLRKSSDGLLQRVAFDLKLYGMAYVNVIWNASRTRIGCIKHLPVHTMRSGIADEEGNVNEYYYKSDWKEKRLKEKTIKAFSLEDRTVASTCLQIKRYTPSLHYYSVPDYAGGTNYCELDQRISDFHLSNIRRGFFPSMLLSFKNGVPTQEERRVIEQKVIQKFTGDDNAGRILITFNDGDETAPSFTPIQQNGADGMYEYLSKLVSEKILTAHRVVSPLMFGIRSEGGGFGNNADELRDSYSLFNNTVIAPFQDIILKTFGMLFGINDIELDLFFITAKPADFLDLDVIETLDEGEQQKEGVTTKDEVIVDEQVDEVQVDDVEEVGDIMPDITIDKEASYNGAQISSALDIIVKVGEGLLTPEQAIVFLVQMLQFDPAVAKALFTEGKDATVEIEKFRSKKTKKKRNVFDESITDYPQSVKNNAKKVLDFVDKNGWGTCGTAVGKQRANQLANGEPISIETVQRMANYLTRHAKDLESSKSYNDGCGKLMYDAWGGKAGLRWAKSRLKQLDLSKEEMSDCVRLSAAESLIEQAEDESTLLKEFSLVDASKVNYDHEEHLNKMWNFAKPRVIPGSSQERGSRGVSEQDNELIRVRYAYMPKKTGINGNPSRDFCKLMIAAGNKVWTKEQIELASDRATNPGWGPAGSDFYNIWFYKGGGSCQHFWERRTYLKKDNKRISVNEARRLIQKEQASLLKKNDIRVAKRPRDMENRGFIDPQIAAKIKTPRN